MTATATPTQTPFTALYPTGQEILNYLNDNGARTAGEIGAAIGYPDASVRRWIGTLRDNGYNIETTPTGYQFRF